MEAMTQAKPLSELSRQFVSHFGEMGSRWGINRTVGQIYALIFMSPRPINADDIAEAKTEAMDVKLDDIEIKR